MVFWMTFQQMKLFDFYRPGDVKFLKNISAAHSFQGIFLSHLSIEELITYLDEKMSHRSFRFMKISSQKMKEKNNNEKIDQTNMNEIQQEMETRGEKSLILSDFRESYSIKLYKLSDIFQYLSVIELTLEECEYNKDNNEKKNQNRNKDTLSSNSKKFNEEKDTEINTNKKVIKTKLFLNSVSVNIFPAFFPLGYFFGFLFLFVPFSDYGVNQKYINELSEILNLNNVTVKHENVDESASSTITIQSKTENILENNPGEEIQLPPSTIFFFSFIICPVLLAAFFLLFF
jgi:hypothetical protein